MIKFAARERLTHLPDAILFDLDNTLYPYKPAHMAAMAAVRAKVTESLAITSADFDRAFKQARDLVKKNLSGTAASHNRLLYFQRMLELLGLGSQVLLALDLEQAYWRNFLSAATLFEGLEEFLDDIRLLGIPTAVVTDLTAQIQFRKILYFRLDKYFDYIVTSEEAGFDKPHPAIFIMALAKISPRGKRIWMVGDDPEADVRGAKQAIGALTWQKLHGDARAGQGPLAPDAGFEEFSELKDFVAGLSEKARIEHISSRGR